MNCFQVTTTKRLLERKNIYLGLALLWTIFMAFLCLSDFDQLPHIRIVGVDKSVHFILHFFFSLFWYLFLSSFTYGRSRKILAVVLASVLYGSFIEVAQALFTTTRKADVLDVLANSVGTVGAIAVILMAPIIGPGKYRKP